MANPKTLSSAHRNVTLTGLINAYGSIGVYDINTGAGLVPETIDAAVFGPAPTDFTVHNAATITSLGTSQFDAGIVLGAPGTIINTGAIDAPTAIAIFGATGTSAVQNEGRLYASIGNAIVTESVADITNSSFIFGRQNGIELLAGGTLTNLAGPGFLNGISGGLYFGVQAQAPATILNSGSIYGYAGGLQLTGGGYVNNAGQISQGLPQLAQYATNAAYAAVELAATGTVTNSGTLTGSNGIKFKAPGNLEHPPTGTATITNTGLISAASTITLSGQGAYNSLYKTGVGIFSNLAGTVDNRGSIYGSHVGIVFYDAVGNVTNAGQISSTQNEGIELEGGGTVTNTGTIYGFNQAIFVGDAYNVPAYISNAGLVASNAPPFVGISTNPATGNLITYISGAIFQLAPGTVYNSGTVTDPNGQGIFLDAFYDDFATDNFGYTTGSLINAGTVTAAYGLIFAGIGGITNTGTVVSQDTAVQVRTTLSQVYNSGLIAATGTTFSNAYGTYTATGIHLNKGGFVTNAATGTISATGGDAIHAYAAPAYVFAYGQISAGKVGIFLSAGGGVLNQGTISAGTSGIYNQGTGALAAYNALSGTIIAAHNGVNDDVGNATLENGGTIIATDSTFINSAGTLSVSHGVLFKYGGSVTNNSTGTIIGATGIAINGSTASYIYNAGQVAGTTRAGIYLQSAGTVINAATGLIHAARPGIELYGGGYIQNAGIIKSGRAGIYLKTGGTAVNTGQISAATDGLYALSAAATVNNSGTITGSNGGIALESGGTVINTGTIAGTAYAIYFAAGFSNRLVVNSTSDLIGTVNLNGGALEFAAGPGIGTFAPENLQILNAGSITIDTGAVLDVAGTFTNGSTGTLLNNGTLKEGTHDLIDFNGPIIGTGVIDISKKPLTFNNSVSSGQKISFTGTGETLALGDPKAFHAKIEDFKLGDTIDLTSIKLSAITATHFAKGILTLSESSTKLEFTFANPSSFAHETFALTTLAHGTAITLAPSAALFPVTPPTTLALTTLA